MALDRQICVLLYRKGLSCYPGNAPGLCQLTIAFANWHFLQNQHVISKGVFNNAPRSANMAETILRLHAVKRQCGMSRTAIYAAIRRGEFPSQVRLSARSVGWLESSIQDWIAARLPKVGVK
jgi:prophage regulatory protein